MPLRKPLRRRRHRHGGWADNSGTGAAWVYIRSGGVWTQQGSKLGSVRQTRKWTCPGYWAGCPTIDRKEDVPCFVNPQRIAAIFPIELLGEMVSIGTSTTTRRVTSPL